MKYKKIENKILLSLNKGDEILQSIYKLAEKENLKFCWLSGIGAFENITLGAYPLEKRDYVKKQFKGEYELTSLLGNITIKEGNPFVHIHVSMSDEEFKAYGGHLFSGYITATCEIIVDMIDFELHREKSEEVGLHLWNLNCG